MYKGIYDRSKASVSVRNEFQSNITRDRHETVVGDVEKCDLVLLLSQQEEECVEEIEKFEQ